MRIHTILHVFGKSFGYFKREDSGICHGSTLRWIEACLLDEEHRFDSRIDKIVKTHQIIHELTKERDFLDVMPNQIGITTNELWSILGFYDSLWIYNDPEYFTSLFEAPVNQIDIEPVSRLAGSDKIRNLGGICQIFYEIGAFDKEIAYAYFSELDAILTRYSTHKIGMVFSSVPHSVGLVYTPNTKMPWKFMDINQYPSKQFSSDSIADLIEYLFLAFNVYHISENSISWSIQLFCAGQQQKSEKLVNFLKQFKKHHFLNPFYLNVHDTSPLVLLAAEFGELKLLRQLFKSGRNINVVSERGISLALIASSRGNARMIHEFGKYIDLNYSQDDGMVPFLYAALNGHRDVIYELRKHAINLNTANKKGYTAACLAARYGHDLMIRDLGRYGANLNLATNKGATPAYIASSYGQLAVLKVLMKHGADLNRATNSGATPLFAAAKRGYLEVVNELIQHAGVDVHKINNYGQTAIYIAKSRGHTEVTRVLKKAIQDELNQIKAVLIEKTNSYLRWRRSLIRDDNRGYEAGFFSSMRSFNYYGKRRAERFKRNLQRANAEEVLTVLKKHLRRGTRMHNHSLDTYLLEGLMHCEEARSILNVPVAPLLTIEDRVFFRDMVLSAEPIDKLEDDNLIIMP